VLLTDARGVILNCVTAPAERRIFERAGLWLGADWSEAREGTNGIGTCLVERQALTIHQDEHFRGRHTGLTCSASPVFDPTANCWRCSTCPRRGLTCRARASSTPWRWSTCRRR
jgi:transcriptional regulator of acetoin/glycerol metabolism